VSPRVFRVVALPAPSDREKPQMYMPTIRPCATTRIPHPRIHRKRVKLPRRSGKHAYDDAAAIANRRFVPERY